MYIEQADRELLDPQPKLRAEDPAALSYQIMQLVDEYIAAADGIVVLHEVMSILECAKLEVFRRLIVPARDQAKLRNGDVLRHAAEDRRMVG